MSDTDKDFSEGASLKDPEGNMISVLTKAIQELSTLITAQQSTIQSLTERITALEGART